MSKPLEFALLLGYVAVLAVMLVAYDVGYQHCRSLWSAGPYTDEICTAEPAYRIILVYAR
jgi:hypothetical protein